MLKYSFFAILSVSILVGCGPAPEPPVATTAPEPEVPSAPSAAAEQSAPVVADPHANIPGMGAPAGGKLAWDAPDDWVQAAPRPMREVTFNMGDSGAIECYVTILASTGGGVAANINRWQQQMGQPVLSAEALAALETVSVLGVDSPIVEVTGDFTSMRGDSKPNHTLLGLVCMRATDAVFVKMIGPADSLPGYKDVFKAFCMSLRDPGGSA